MSRGEYCGFRNQGPVFLQIDTAHVSETRRYILTMRKVFRLVGLLKLDIVNWPPYKTIKKSIRDIQNKPNAPRPFSESPVPNCSNASPSSVSIMAPELGGDSKSIRDISGQSAKQSTGAVSKQRRFGTLWEASVHLADIPEPHCRNQEIHSLEYDKSKAARGGPRKGREGRGASI